MEEKKEGKRKIALVLGSGGARGMAHIGVIEELLKKGYEISSISGCSIGSRVGGFYAAGKLEAFKEWVLQLDKLDVYSLFDFTLDSQGLIKGDRIFRKIEHVIPDQNIEDLGIPFTAIAADVNKGEIVEFSSGSLFTAIRASSAIPTILTPVKHDDSELVDGGVLCPLPIRYVRRKEEDMLVVVDVSSAIPYAPLLDVKEMEKERNEYLKKLDDFLDKWKGIVPNSRPKFESNNMLSLMNKSFRIMQNRLSDMLLEATPPDLLIRISRDSCGTFELYRAHEMIETGRKAFLEAYEEFQVDRST